MRSVLQFANLADYAGDCSVHTAHDEATPSAAPVPFFSFFDVTRVSSPLELNEKLRSVSTVIVYTLVWINHLLRTSGYPSN